MSETQVHSEPPVQKPELIEPPLPPQVREPAPVSPPAVQEPPLPPSSAPVTEPPLPPAPAPSPVPDMSEVARQREWDRLMTLANVHRVRGQFSAARDTLLQALALGGGNARRDAQVNEFLGDISTAEEKWEEAKKYFGTAHALDPARASAEKKFARAALEVAEAARERDMAAAMLRGEIPPGGLNGGPGKRVPGLALLLSALIPGLGQFYNGQLVKGAICVGIFVITLGALRLSPDGDLLLRQLMGMLLVMPVAGSRGEASPGLWMLVICNAAVWLFSIVDAPMVASKMSKDAERFAAPRIDPADLLNLDVKAKPESGPKV